MFSGVKRFVNKHILGSGVRVITKGNHHPLIKMAVKELEALVCLTNVRPWESSFLSKAIVPRFSHELKQGMEFLGNGGYALVAQHPDYPGVVVKIANNDEAYDKYVEQCQLRQHTWMPRIYERVEVEPTVRCCSSGMMYIYLMEKLEPIFTDNLREEEKFMMQWIFRHARWATLKAAEKCIPDYLEFVQNINKTNSRFYRYMDMDPVSRKYTKEYRDMIFELHKEYEFQSDVEHRNVMMRPGTRDIVITDPIHCLRYRKATDTLRFVEIDDTPEEINV